MVPNATEMRENEHIHTFDALSRKNPINWNTSTLESGWDWHPRVVATYLNHVNVVLGQSACKSASVDIFVKIAH